MRERRLGEEGGWSGDEGLRGVGVYLEALAVGMTERREDLREGLVKGKRSVRGRRGGLVEVGAG